MPFALFTGCPSSGKSTVAEQLYNYLTKERGLTNVHWIRDELQSTFSRKIYDSPAQEKEQRGFLRSEVQRYLTAESTVILDSLNYIKGFRYELYCIAKACKTTYCVIYCDANGQTVRQFNERKPEAERYTEDMLAALIMRFECPDARNRWDNPVFTINPGSEVSTFTETENVDQAVPLGQIYQCLYESGKVLTPNLSTQTQPLAPTNFLYELERITQEIVAAVMAEQKSAMPGDEVTVPNTTEKVQLKKHFTLPELTRLKRQYIAYTKTQGVVTQREVLGKLFVSFINNAT